MQHYPADRAHLANGGHLAGPIWFHVHFAIKQIQDNCADEDHGITRDDKNRKPCRESSVIGVGFAPIADAEGDDTTQKKSFVRDRIKITAERAALVVSARNITIQPVAHGSENKNSDRRKTLPFERFAAFDALAIIDRHQHKGGDHQNPDNGDLIGGGHDAGSANNCRAFR